MNVFSEARRRLKMNVWTLAISAFVGLVLLFALPTPSFAQSGENAATGSTGCVDWNDGPGQLTNSTNFIVEVDMCGGNNGHLLPGQTSNDNLKDIEAVWGLCDTSGDGLCAYRTLGNKNIPITKRYNISRYSYGPPSYGILPSANEERDPSWQSPAIHPTYRVVQDVFFLPKFVLYFGKQHVSPMWDTLSYTELNLSPAQKSSLNSIWLQDYRSMLLTNTASSRQRCIWYSLNDINMDQFPGGNSSMGLKNNIDRIQTFGDNTCGGLDRNQDGIVDSNACPAVVSASAVNANTIANDSCGTNPNPNPGVTPVPPPPSNPQNPAQHVIVYLQRDYQNAYYELEPGGWDIDNREYNSISVPSGWSFVLEDSRDGHHSCYSQSLNNLQDHESWRFNIGAIDVYDSNVCTSNGGGTQPEPLGDWFARFWSEEDFWDWSLAVKFTGDENYFWLPNLRDNLSHPMNDDFESLEVNTNRAVAVYEHDGLQGGVKCFTGNDSNLWDDRFDNGLTVGNQVSSVRFFTRSECNLRPNTPPEIWVHEAKRGSITITWVKSSPDTDSYNIKLFGNGSYNTLVSISEDQAKQNAQNLGLDTNWIRAWTYTSVTCGTNYTFVVSARNDRAESYNTRPVTGKFECDCNDPQYEGVGLYDLRYCQGDNIVMTVPGWNYLTNFNNRASSIFVKPGWSVEVFDKTNNADGSTVCMNESKWDLAFDKYWIQDQTIDGTVGAVRVWNVPNCGRTLPLAGCDALQTNSVTLFDHTHCLGLDKSFSSPGFNKLTDFDDLTSSIYVPTGKSARLYVNGDKGGNYACVRDTKWDMHYDFYWPDSSQNTFNNISAIEIFNDNLCGGVQTPVVTSPTENSQLQDIDPISFIWDSIYAGGYWGELWGPNAFFKSSGHLTQNSWSVGVLEPGNYTFRVNSEVYCNVSAWSTELHFAVVDTTPAPQMTASYSLNPTQLNKVTFTAFNCSGEWVHVTFGDGKFTDSPCINGNSRTEHDYDYSGAAVTYNALVGSVALEVKIPAAEHAKDCNELFPSAGVSLFAEKNCQGASKTYSTEGRFELSDFNDQTTSIVPAVGWSVEVFEHSGSGDGNAFCVTRDMWDLSLDSYYATEGLKIDNTISNIRVYRNQTCGKQFPQYGGCGTNIAYNGIVLFDYKHCGGSEFLINQAGKYELGYGGSFNDLTSSIHVGAGWSIKVFSDSSYSGLASCFAGDMWNLGVDKYWESQSTVGNTISSVEVYANAECKPDTPAPSKPSAPANLQPTGGIFEVNKVQKFTWQGIADYFTVEYINGPTSYSITTTVASLDFAAPEEGSYTWRVKATKAGMTSDWSATANFTVKGAPPVQTVPSAVSDLLAASVTKTQVSLTWKHSGDNEAGFIVTRWNGQQFAEVGRTGANVTVFADNGLTCNTQYKYQVVAFNAVGNSQVSSTLVAKTANCDVVNPASQRVYLPLITR